MSWKTFVLVLASLLFSLPAMAAEELMGSATTASDDVRMLYSKYCSVCHGDKGDGNTRASGSMNPRPRDFTHPEAKMDLTRERMISSVTHGRPGTGMVAHGNKLNGKQIEGLVDYIMTKFMRVSVAGDASVLAKHSAGRSIYEQNCSSCHGDRGAGAVWARSGLNPAPRNFTAAEAKKELNRGRMIHSVTKGRPGTAMQPFSGRLSAEQISQVVDYIRADFMKSEQGGLAGKTPAPAATATPPVAKADPHQGPHDRGMQTPQAAVPPDHAALNSDMKASMPKDLKPDLVWGQSFYMKNCITCHGAKGDGNGPRSHFITPRPRNFTNEMSRSFYNRPQLYDAISNGKRGTVMPAWSKVLSDQEVANVAEFVFMAYIRQELKLDGITPEKKKAN